ncbi:MAG: S41 family peptidase [Solobacterium sp.]|nr:S41 family peptidase [Solobacterium sp.]
MEEMEKQEVADELTNEEEMIRIPLKRHMYKEEVTILNQEKRIKRLRAFVIIGVVFSLLLGWALGTLFPLINRNRVTLSPSLNSNNKISEVINIMQNNWLFGKDIEDLETRLENQALQGITTNEEDLHTEYMSAEEVKDFRESINRNFVGIGIQYFTIEDRKIIERVFKGFPADKAGLQSGDIIYKVDGVEVEGMTSDEVKERVTGVEGSTVVITVKRQGKEMDFSIQRAPVTATAYGEILDGEIGYINLYQFGEKTAENMDAYLDEFKKENINKLIIDLRGNGGGYVSSLEAVASRFIKGGQVIMVEEFLDGTKDNIYSHDGKLYDNFSPIVILINAGTASASEIFTLDMKELRDDVTIIGTKSYGKGTVQVTREFDDGSALKYTTSKWLSPNGVWINGTGIEPDIVVEIPEALQKMDASIEENSKFEEDSVSTAVSGLQYGLEYLGYKIDRKDGYFSKETKEVLLKFEKDNGLKEDGILTETDYETLMSLIAYDIYTSNENDTQLQKALEILNG